MRRREFITLLGGAAAAWPLRRGRSSRRCRVIGFSRASPRHSAQRVWRFRAGLRELGYARAETC